MENRMNPTRLFCRLGKTVLASPVGAMEAVERLEAAGVAVFFGGLPAPYGTKASCRRHGLVRINGYREAIVCARQTGSADGCLEQAMIELEPHLTGLRAQESGGISPYLPTEVLSGKLMWWCGLEGELVGPGKAWLERMRKRLPWFEQGLWPTGCPDRAIGVAIDGMLDGADAVMCAGPGISEGAPLVQVAVALTQAGMKGVDVPAISSACRAILERAGLPAAATLPASDMALPSLPISSGIPFGREIHSV